MEVLRHLRPRRDLTVRTLLLALGASMSLAACAAYQQAGPLTPTRRGKTVAVTQVVGLTFALIPAVPPAISTPAAAATLAALTWSFAVDILRLRPES